MVFGLFRRRHADDPIERLYGAIVAASRDVPLYAAMGVPDTVMGRFESLGLHVALVLRRLKALPPPAQDIAQELVDRFFKDLDGSLREIGVGDLSVPKKIKALAQAFYGRMGAYDAALGAEAAPQALAEALARNVLDLPDAKADALAAEVRRRVGALDRVGVDDLLAGRLAPAAATA